jgi:hypothetical protein
MDRRPNLQPKHSFLVSAKPEECVYEETTGTLEKTTCPRKTAQMTEAGIQEALNQAGNRLDKALAAMATPGCLFCLFRQAGLWYTQHRKHRLLWSPP